VKKKERGRGKKKRERRRRTIGRGVEEAQGAASIFSTS